jgi:hypothetical protein
MISEVTLVVIFLRHDITPWDVHRSFLSSTDLEDDMAVSGGWVGLGRHVGSGAPVWCGSGISVPGPRPRCSGTEQPLPPVRDSSPGDGAQTELAGNGDSSRGPSGLVGPSAMQRVGTRS